VTSMLIACIHRERKCAWRGIEEFFFCHLPCCLRRQVEGRHHSHAAVSEALIFGGGRRGRLGSRAGESAVERQSTYPPSSHLPHTIGLAAEH